MCEKAFKVILKHNSYCKTVHLKTLILFNLASFDNFDL